jgi:hypothetical protein
VADEKYNKNSILNNDDTETDGGESGSGSQGSQIAFADFIGIGTSVREPILEGQLSHDQQKHWDWLISSTHEARVVKQLEKVKNLQALKNGQTSLNAYRHEKGMGAGVSSQYKSHPSLRNLTGADPQVSSVPELNQADTNQELQAKLELQYNLRHRPDNAPRFNPQLKRQ